MTTTFLEGSKMTIEEIKSQLEKTGIEHEIRKNEEQSWQTLIGIKLRSKHVWHWFTYNQFTNSTFTSFDHSYSQNTGRTKKGLAHRIKTYEVAKNATGIQF